MNGRCKTCRWWQSPDDSGKREATFLYLTSTDNPDMGLCIREREPGARMYLYAEACHGETGLLTAPSFGCVEWEARES